MPRFSIPQRSVLPSGQVGGAPVPEGLLAGEGQADAGLARAIGQAGDVLFEFSQRMAAAENETAISSASTKYNEVIGTMLESLKTRTDWHEFEDEFEKVSSNARSDILGDKTLSPAARRQIGLDLDRLSARSKIQVIGLANKTRFDRFTAAYKVNRESMQRAGDLEGVNRLTNAMADNGVIFPEERKSHLIENENLVNYYKAFEAAQFQPENAEAIAKEFALTPEHADLLISEAGKQIKVTRDAEREQVLGEIHRQLNNPDFSLPVVLDFVSVAERQGYLRPAQAEQFRQDFRTADQNRRDDAITQADEARKQTLKDLRANTQWIREAVRAGHLNINQAITKAESLLKEQELTGLVDLEFESIAFSIIADLKDDRDSQVKDRMSFAANYIDNETSISKVLLFGVHYDPKKEKKRIADFEKRIQKEDDPAIRARLQAREFEERAKRTQFADTLFRDLEAKIKADPKISDDEIRSIVDSFARSPMTDATYRETTRQAAEEMRRKVESARSRRERERQEDAFRRRGSLASPEDTVPQMIRSAAGEALRGVARRIFADDDQTELERRIEELPPNAR